MGRFAFYLNFWEKIAFDLKSASMRHKLLKSRVLLLPFLQWPSKQFIVNEKCISFLSERGIPSIQGAARRLYSANAPKASASSSKSLGPSPVVSEEEFNKWEEKYEGF